MEYVVKLGKDTTHEDYHKMLRNHELDDVRPICECVVREFKQKFPSTIIDSVQIVINKPDSDLQKVDTIIMQHTGKKVIL